MSKIYSIYDAKAKLSELLRYVKDGEEVVITERGKPIAKVSPFEEAQTFEERIAEFRKKGIIQEARKKGPLPDFGIKRPGALKRFLEERD